MGPGGRVELGTPTSMVDRKAAWICCEMGLRSNKTLLGCFSSRTRSFFPFVWFGWPAAWSTKMGLDGLFVLDRCVGLGSGSRVRPVLLRNGLPAPTALLGMPRTLVQVERDHGFPPSVGWGPRKLVQVGWVCVSSPSLIACRTNSSVCGEPGCDYPLFRGRATTLMLAVRVGSLGPGVGRGIGGHDRAIGGGAFGALYERLLGLAQGCYGLFGRGLRAFHSGRGDARLLRSSGAVGLLWSARWGLREWERAGISWAVRRPATFFGMLAWTCRGMSWWLPALFSGSLRVSP